MRLDFSKLSQPVQKSWGQVGTLGTASIHAGLSCPQSAGIAGDTWGQNQQGAEMSPMSPALKQSWGHRKPACSLIVPNVPNVPTKKGEISNASGEIDLVREFMEVDGLTLEEAQALAAISVQPRPAAEWLALIADLDAVIERYCDAVGAAAEARAAMLATRYAQPLASIPESLAWFRSELAVIERSQLAQAVQAAPAAAGNYEDRASAKAARAALHQPIEKGVHD